MLYKRKGSKFWWTRFQVGKIRVRESTKTTKKKEAQEYENAKRERIWRQQKVSKSHGVSWAEAVVRWIQETDKRTVAMDEEIIAWLDPYLGHLTLAEIDIDVIRDIRNARTKETSKATCNRYMSLVKAILNKARDEWEWVTSIPKVPMWQIEAQEPRFITPDEFEAFAELLPVPLKHIARFAVLTGLRRQNVTHLEWSRVNLEQSQAWIPASSSKNKKTFTCYLNSEAVELLESLKGDHKRWVFVYKHRDGELGPVVQTTTRMWRAAVEKAGIAPFRFHDLRHTWASWHIQRGTTLPVLQRLGGWSDISMVMRYAHLGASDLRLCVENSCTKVAQFGAIKKFKSVSS